MSLGFRTFADISHVTFRDLTDEEITEYLRKGESFDKAGAYAIQGEGRRSLTTTTAPLTPSSACLRHASSRNSPTS